MVMREEYLSTYFIAELPPEGLPADKPGRRVGPVKDLDYTSKAFDLGTILRLGVCFSRPKSAS
jgi:hypothetical protein